MEVYLSPLNPINFTKKNDENSGELQRTYIQQFHKDDKIVLQLVGDAGMVVIAYINQSAYTFSEYNIGIKSAYNIEINCSTLPIEELLSLQINVSKDDEYATFNSVDYFEVIESECMELIKYTDKTNLNPFNTNFDNGTVFQLRLPMGFKSTSINERLASETFRNQNQELRHLYSFPYQSQSLIIGDGLGIPTWLATLVNYIFCLSNVYIGNQQYVRSDESVPERQGGLDGYPLHIYTMTVESVTSNTITISKGDFNADFNESFMI